MTENGDKKEFGLPGVCGIALFTVLFCVLFPYLGFVSLAAVTAMTGVLVASWRNPLCFAVPLPGIAAAMLIWKSVPAGVILAALVLSGIVLGLVMRTHRSALSHVLSVVISYAVIAAAAYCICCIVYYGGISNGTAAFADRFTEYVSETFAALAENDATGTVSALLESVSAEKYASSMLLVLPGIAAVAIEILGPRNKGFLMPFRGLSFSEEYRSSVFVCDPRGDILRAFACGGRNCGRICFAESRHGTLPRAYRRRIRQTLEHVRTLRRYTPRCNSRYMHTYFSYSAGGGGVCVCGIRSCGGHIRFCKIKDE